MVNVKLLQHIKKLKRSRTKLYREDGATMDMTLYWLKQKRNKLAQSTFWHLDTAPRDDFLRLYTNNHKNKKAMKELTKKLKVHWNI